MQIICGHTCPVCGQYCNCRGDWDDMDMGEDPDCEHCPEGFDGPDEDNDYYIEDPSEDPERNPLK